jgi:hypothetical protein
MIDSRKQEARKEAGKYVTSYACTMTVAQCQLADTRQTTTLPVDDT